MINEKPVLKSLLICLILFFAITTFVFAESSDVPHTVNIYFFWGDGCPHCATEKPFLESLVEKYPQIELNTYEVYYDEENRALFWDFGEALGFEPQGVPTTIIGKQVWVGFREEYKAEIEAAVQACVANQCEFDPGAEVFSPDEEIMAEKPSEHVIQLPLLGAVDLGKQSLFASTAIIGFVDGFNPCSLWVLSVLLAITLHSGSRTKMMIVGLTFLLTTTIVYSLFIAGVFSILSYVGYLGWIQILVSLVAMVFGLVNLKDYFWYKEGVSFTISNKHKPKLYQNMRSTVVTPRSVMGLIGSTAVLAIGVSLIEFACTAGFPVIWSNLVSSSNISTATFIFLLAVYMVIYLIDELVIFGAAVITMKASRLEEKHGRLLKLISGVVILTLGVVMLINPELMNQLNSSILVFGLALISAFLMFLIHQKILPQFGIYIGTGFKKTKNR
jgi:thiol-disulfide isomerase/thioredoxin